MKSLKPPPSKTLSTHGSLPCTAVHGPPGRGPMELRDECSTIRLDDGVRNTFIAISGFCTEAKKNIWMIYGMPLK